MCILVQFSFYWHNKVHQTSSPKSQSLSPVCTFSLYRYCAGEYATGAAYGLLGIYVPVPVYGWLDGGAYTGAYVAGFVPGYIGGGA